MGQDLNAVLESPRIQNERKPYHDEVNQQHSIQPFFSPISRRPDTRSWTVTIIKGRFERKALDTPVVKEFSKTKVPIGFRSISLTSEAARELESILDRPPRVQHKPIELAEWQPKPKSEK